MLGLLISAGILCAVMYFIAKEEAEIQYGVVILICLGVSILSYILGRTLHYFSIPIVIGALAWALHQFCYLRWPKAILVTLVYQAVGIGIGILLR